MNKVIIISIFLISVVSSYFVVGSILYQEPEYDIDPIFNSLVNELEDYDGAMIVSYDVETGKITGKRKVGEPREAGLFTVTATEAKQVGRDLPEDALVIKESATPGQAVEYIGGTN